MCWHRLLQNGMCFDSTRSNDWPQYEHKCRAVFGAAWDEAEDAGTEEERVPADLGVRCDIDFESPDVEPLMESSLSNSLDCS